MTLNPRHLSLRTKLVAIVTMLFAIEALILLLFYSTRIEQLSRSWVQRRAISVTQLVANVMKPAVSYDDSETVSDLLRSFAVGSDVTYAAVLRPGGAQMAAWNPEQMPKLDLRPDGDHP